MAGDRARAALERVEALRAVIRAGGGADKAAEHRARGRWTARERLDALFDADTFVELDGFAKHTGRDYGLDAVERVPADGVVTGFGRINGRTVYAYAQDFTTIAGSFGEMHGRKIARTVELAARCGAPVIGLNDSAGARVTEQMGALAGYGRLFREIVRASGRVPQIALVLGPVSGGQAYATNLADFALMTRGSHLYIAGPALVESVVFERTDDETLGGADMHATQSGCIDLVLDDDRAALAAARLLLEYLPQAWGEAPPARAAVDFDRPCTAAAAIVPDDPAAVYDMRELVADVMDAGSMFELKPDFAPNLCTAFARLGGRAVGVIASNPAHLGGVITAEAAQKAARFVRLCDRFDLPVVSFQDVPGCVVGSQAEAAGVIRHAAKLIHAVCEATVPKLTVIVRKAYAGGYIAMGSKDTGADFVFAWPQAEICLMGPAGAVGILYRKEIAAARSAGRDPAEVRAEAEAQFRARYVDPLYAAGGGHIDDVIDPVDTRRVLVRALAAVAGKRDVHPPKKHTGVPI